MCSTFSRLWCLIFHSLTLGTELYWICTDFRHSVAQLLCHASFTLCKLDLKLVMFSVYNFLQMVRFRNFFVDFGEQVKSWNQIIVKISSTQGNCNGRWLFKLIPFPPLSQEKGNPPLLKLLNSPQSSNFLVPLQTWNKQDMKLKHKPLIQHNCQKKNKKKTKKNKTKKNNPKTT